MSVTKRIVLRVSFDLILPRLVEEKERRRKIDADTSGCETTYLNVRNCEEARLKPHHTSDYKRTMQFIISTSNYS